MKNQLTRTLAFAILAAVVMAAPAGAQMTGRVVGTVVDDNDHSISGMSVRATDLLDGSKIYFATSDTDGGFVISDLAIGTYVVAAETANTQWVQKHDSPVVKVSTDPATVTLTLVSLAQLQGDGGGGGGGGGFPLGGLTLGAAIVGAATGTYAAINSQDAKDEAAAAKLAADRARKAAEDSNNDLSNKINGLSGRLDQVNDRLTAVEGGIYDINGQLIGINGVLFDIQNDLDDLQDDVNDILDTLY